MNNNLIGYENILIPNIILFFFNDARVKSISATVTVESSGHFSIDGVNAYKVIGIVLNGYYERVCITNHNSSFRAVLLTNSGTSIVSQGTKLDITAYYIA